ncbi:ester cyclase [Pseudohalioglobus sediminis]|uniref:Ester cyclase n=1 Tax=Pseudohalioglobus sediminis TaxID=2606449 RepID=A0A5B0WMZ4_9GAMM|nr:ester cyclase [Pseudohalioglobus sediminis]KAA1188430.1 ester cyclase [Pseudohalioglobus sediminis]
MQHAVSERFSRAIALGLGVLLLALLPYANAAGEDRELAALRAQANTESANKELVRRWLSELWDQARFEVADELLAEKFTRHSEGYPAQGPDAYVAIIKSCHDAFPDTRITMVAEPIAEGDRVFVRWRWTGTHEHPFRGVAPTSRKIDVLGEDVIRIQDGRITDVWPLFDPLRLMFQLGALQQVAGDKLKQ